MRSFFEWFGDSGGGADAPWLILGKGPSFSRLRDFDVSGYRLLSLNHVVRELPVAVAHIIDYDVVEACGEAIEANAQVLAMPWIPHVKNRPGEKTLEEWAAESPVLRHLDAQGRLLWYNLSTARRQRGDSPIVRVRFFSAEAALNLLAACGVKRVRSLGVDGGSTYSNRFEDLKDKTLLANTRTSFDQQFQEIARTLLTTGIDYGPLDLEVPARVYVGCTEAQMLSVRVLEYSIRRHAGLRIELHPLHRAGVPIPVPKRKEAQPRTPFSFQRFLIPALAGRRGRALYLDSDMLVFKDLRGLWGMPFAGADLLTVGEPAGTGRRPQFSVMLLDCEALRWDIAAIVDDLDAGRLTYEALVYEMCLARSIRTSIEPFWNSLERYNEGETGLLHYTDMPTQPWIYARNPLGHLWVRALIEAIDARFIAPEYVEDHVDRGYVRPSLVYQIDHRLEDGAALPPKAQRLDDGYVPPYKGNGKGRAASKTKLRGLTRLKRGIAQLFR